MRGSILKLSLSLIWSPNLVGGLPLMVAGSTWNVNHMNTLPNFKLGCVVTQWFSPRAQGRFPLVPPSVWLCKGGGLFMQDSSLAT